MKPFITLLGIILMPVCVTGQQRTTPVQVPSEVTASLKKVFPETTPVKWEEKKEKYKAEFKVGKTKHEVWMNKAGTISKHQYEVKKEDLPQAVNETLAREFSTYTIHDCERTDSDGNTSYKIEIKSSAGKKKVNIANDGKVIVKRDDL